MPGRPQCPLAPDKTSRDFINKSFWPHRHHCSHFYKNGKRFNFREVLATYVLPWHHKQGSCENCLQSLAQQSEIFSHRPLCSLFQLSLSPFPKLKKRRLRDAGRGPVTAGLESRSHHFNCVLLSTCSCQHILWLSHFFLNRSLDYFTKISVLWSL